MRLQDQKFIDAIVNENIPLALEAITEGADVNVKNEKGEPALLLAVTARKINSINFLLDQGVDVNAVNGLNETALILAVKEGYIEAVRAFLKVTNVNLHIQSYLYGTALTTAIYFDRNEIIDLLLSKEEAIDNNKHPLALVCAVWKDNSVLLSKLLKKGADVNSSGKEGYIKSPYWVKDLEDESPFTPVGPPVFDLPIVVAMQGNYVDSLRALMSYKPDLKKKGSSNLSAEDLLKSNSISDETKNIVRQNVSSSTSSGRKSPAFFNTNSATSSTDSEAESSLTESALVVFFGLFDGVWEALEYFGKEDQELIINILNDHSLTPMQASQLIQQIEIENGLSHPHLSSSFDILFCGLFPQKWEVMNDKMKVQNFFDTAVKFCLPKNSENTEREKIIAKLKEKASEYLKKLINTFNQELQNKENTTESNALQNQRKQTLLTKISNQSITSIPNSPSEEKSFVEEYLEPLSKADISLKDAQKTKIEAEIISAIADMIIKGPAVLNDQSSKHSETVSSAPELFGIPLNLFRWNELNLTSQKWKKIFEVVKNPEIYKGKERDENLMLSVVKAILYKHSTNCRWIDLPQWCPSRGKVTYYYKEWQKTGQLRKILSIATIHVKAIPDANATPANSGFQPLGITS